MLFICMDIFQFLNVLRLIFNVGRASLPQNQNWELIPQKSDLKPEGSASNSTFKYSRNTKKGRRVDNLV